MISIFYTYSLLIFTDSVEFGQMQSTAYADAREFHPNLHSVCTDRRK